MSGKKYILPLALLAVALLAAVLGLVFSGGDGDPASNVKDENPDKAIEGLDEVVKQGGEEVDDVLVVAVEHPDPQVRSRALGYMGRRRKPEYVAHIRRGMEDKDGRVRSAATRAMGYQSKSAEPLDRRQLEERLTKDESPAVQAAAAESLGRLQAWEAMPKLCDAMNHPNIKVRSAAWAAVQAMSDGAIGFKFDPRGGARQRARDIANIRRNWREAYAFWQTRQAGDRE